MQFLHILGLVSDDLRQSVQRAREALDLVDPDQAAEAIGHLRSAGEHLSAALNEALSEAALEGRSVRQLANDAGMAPNSIPPRLGASSALAPYAEGGRVTREGLARARYDRRTPLRFTPRRSTHQEDA